MVLLLDSRSPLVSALLVIGLLSPRCVLSATNQVKGARVTIQTVNVSCNRNSGVWLSEDVKYVLRSQETQVPRPFVELCVLIEVERQYRLIRLYAARPNSAKYAFDEYSTRQHMRTQPLVDVNTFAPNAVLSVKGRHYMHLANMPRVVCYRASVFIDGKLAAEMDSPGLSLLVRSKKVLDTWDQRGTYEARQVGGQSDVFNQSEPSEVRHQEAAGPQVAVLPTPMPKEQLQSEFERFKEMKRHGLLTDGTVMISQDGGSVYILHDPAKGETIETESYGYSVRDRSGNVIEEFRVDDSGKVIRENQ